jgi:diacylglycerol kinase (ATP)
MPQSAEQPRAGTNQNRGLMRMVSATAYSLSGLRAAWRSESAFRQEALSALILLPTAFWLGTNAVERALLAGAVLLVLVVELLNTALECAVDRIGTEPHRLSGRAKDMGSAAVMLSLVLWAVTWGAVAWERFF